MGLVPQVLQGDFKLSADVLGKYGNWQRPSEELARKVHAHDHPHHHMFDVYSTPTKDLKEFGEGHLLYFYFLKYAAWLFCGLSIAPSLIIFIVYSAGGYFGKSVDLQYSTIGNYGLISFNGPSSLINVSLPGTGRGADAEAVIAQLFANDGVLAPAKLPLGWNKRTTIMIMSILDVVGALVYFGASLWFMYFTQAAAKAASDSIITVDDYTVRVDNLPPDASVDEVGEFCARHGDIMMVELCRSCDELIQRVRERQEATTKLDMSNALLQRHAEVYPKVSTQLEVDVLENKFEVALQHEGVRDAQVTLEYSAVVAAFVTFKDDEVKEACLLAQPTAIKSLLVALRVKPPIPNEERFRGGSVSDPVFTAAAAPTDIQFENLEFDPSRRFWLLVLSAALTYGAVLLGFFLINLAPALRQNLNKVAGGPAQSTCMTNCHYLDDHGNFNITLPVRIDYKSCYDDGVHPNKMACEGELVCYECFCKTALNRGVYGESGYCSPFAYVLVLNTISQALAVLSIVTVNYFILTIIAGVTKIERHHTRSDESRATIRGLFLSQFLNTAISMLIANAYLPGVVEKLPTKALKAILFTGVFGDPTPNWYADVGRPLVLAMLVGLLGRLAFIYSGILYRQIRIKLRYQSMTQKELQESYEGHAFELATRYGEHLTVVFVTLMYSGSMPVLNWLAALSFGSHYWLEKYELLKVCKRPVAYSADMAVYVASTLPFATLWHMAWSLWSFSFYVTPRSNIVPGRLYRGIQSLMVDMQDLFQFTTQQGPQRMVDRLLQSDSAHFLYMLIICAGAIFLVFTLTAWVRLVRKLLRLLNIIKTDTVDPEELPDFGVAVRTQLLVGETAYAMQSLSAYSQAFEQLDDYDQGVPLVRRIMDEAAALGNKKLNVALMMRRKRVRNNKIVPETPSIN